MNKEYNVTPLGYARLKELSPLKKWILEEIIQNGTMTEEQIITNCTKYYPSHSPPTVAN
jgi:hypothetical protein